MARNKEDKQPLLYIAQPSFAEAKLNMQETYVLRKQQEVRNKRALEVQEKELTQNHLEEPIQEEAVKTPVSGQGRQQSEVAITSTKKQEHPKEEVTAVNEQGPHEHTEENVTVVNEQERQEHPEEEITAVNERERQEHSEEEVTVVNEQEPHEHPEEEATIVNEQEHPGEEATVVNEQEHPEEEATVVNEQEHPEEEVTVVNEQEHPEEEVTVVNEQEHPEEEATVVNEQEHPEEEVTVVEEQGKQILAAAAATATDTEELQVHGRESQHEQRPVLSSVWQVKPFKEMTNEEKLHFLANRPHYIPKTVCEVRTVHNSFTGYVLAFKNGAATIKVFTTNRTKDLQIKLEDILSIRMIGL